MTESAPDFSQRIPITILLVAVYFLIGVYGLLHFFTPDAELKSRTLVVLSAAPFALASISILVAPYSIGPERLSIVAVVTLPLICLIWDVTVSLLFALPVASIQVHQNIDTEYAKFNLGIVNLLLKAVIGACATYAAVRLTSEKPVSQ